MAHTVARVGTAVGSIVALTIGVLDLVDSWPQWVWIGLGVVGLVAIVIEFAWERRGGAETSAAKVNQSQTGGAGSTNFQAGRDITYNEESGKGQ